MTLCRRSERRQARRLRRPGLPAWTEDEAPSQGMWAAPRSPRSWQKGTQPGHTLILVQ